MQVIVAVPVVIPVTTPDVLMEAMDGLLLLQEVPELLVRGSVEPTQIADGPEMIGVGLTAMVELPVILLLQLVAVFVPKTVNVPGAL